MTGERVEPTGLLPGTTAFAARRRARLIAWPVIALALVVVCVVLIPRASPLPGWWLAIAIGADLIGSSAILISRLVAERRRAAEEAAGYSTLAGVRFDLDERDPASGRITRVAASAVPLRGAYTVVVGPPPRFTRAALPSVYALVNLVGGSVVFGGLLIAGAVELVVGTPDLRQRVAVPFIALACIVAVCAALVVILRVGIRNSRRRQVDRVAARLDGAFVLLSSTSQGTRQATSALALDSLRPGVVLVALTDSDIQLWLPGLDTPALIVPWASVSDVVLGRTLIGVNPARTAMANAVVVRVTIAGRTADMPLAVFGRLASQSAVVAEFAQRVAVTAGEVAGGSVTVGSVTAVSTTTLPAGAR